MLQSTHVPPIQCSRIIEVTIIHLVGAILHEFANSRPNYSTFGHVVAGLRHPRHFWIANNRKFFSQKLRRQAFSYILQERRANTPGKCYQSISTQFILIPNQMSFWSTFSYLHLKTNLHIWTPTIFDQHFSIIPFFNKLLKKHFDRICLRQGESQVILESKLLEIC